MSVTAGDRGGGTRIGILAHEPLPSTATYGEQLVSSAAALARRALTVELVVPEAASAGELEAHYGLPEGALSEVAVVETGTVALPTRTLRHGGHDLRGGLQAAGRGYDLVLTRDLFAVVIALAAGCRVVWETYRTDVGRARRFAPWRRYCLGHPAFLGAVTHSRMASRSLRAAGLAAERICVARNAAPRPRGPSADGGSAPGDLREDLGLEADEPVLCYAGAVGRAKGTDLLPEIAAGLPDARLLVVGLIPGSREARRFRDLLAGSGVDDAVCVDRVPPSRVEAYLGLADCLIVPPAAAPLEQHGNTVLPIKTYRYLAAGRPVVAPDRRDLRELLRHGVNALLVPVDDPGAAADAVRRVLEDRTLAQRLARGAARTAELQPTWDERAALMAAAFRRWLDRDCATGDFS